MSQTSTVGGEEDGGRGGGRKRRREGGGRGGGRGGKRMNRSVARYSAEPSHLFEASRDSLASFKTTS